MMEIDTPCHLKAPFYFGSIKDMPFLKQLEEEAFDPFKRSSSKILERSIRSKDQLVVMMRNADGKTCASMILRLYKKKLNIYSVAVRSCDQGKGYGRELIRQAIDICKTMNRQKLTLIVEANNNTLIRWYESLGFGQMEIISDYYGEDKSGLKMELKLQDHFRYIAVTDYETDFFDAFTNVKWVRAAEYIESPALQKARNVRVFNFCADYSYQTVGYYVSLLALARNQVAYPGAGLLRDIDNKKVIQSIGDEVKELIQRQLKESPKKEVTIHSLFGVSEKPDYQMLVTALNNLYRAPLLSFHFVKKQEWILDKMTAVALNSLSTQQQKICHHYAKTYFHEMHFIKSSMKSYAYDMAFLVDPAEELPPSDSDAMLKFEKAAEFLGFRVEYITKQDYARIPEFDALFIRTTTNVNDYTYEFSRYAYAEGLVVMDDPWSILRCANKIYLYEALRNAKIPMPKTWVINQHSDYKKQIKKLEYPVILKLPDSAFSAGVYKVADQSECLSKLNEMFEQSELLIAQEYMPTEFDWRIGILDGELLYACKYYMAKNHWQIVHWEDGRFDEGGYEAMQFLDVPAEILTTALNAAKVIGDGLYGVDLKYTGGKVFVIEINDNPSIDQAVEDGAVGDELYIKIMRSFYNRLENNMNVLRTIG